MNENHLRHIVATFEYIGSLLKEAEHAMSSVHETALAHEHVARIRNIMAETLESLGAERSTVAGSALWTARTKVLYSNVALGDIEVSRMAGYGKLTVDDTRMLETIVARLQAELKALGEYLAQLEDEDAG